MSNISANTKICLVIGDPISHTLSPKMHNYAYEKLGIAGEFVFLAAHVKANQLADAISSIRALSIRGCSVTLPYKTEVLNLIDKVDVLAEKIGAVNTIVNNGGYLYGYNTDYYGFLIPLEKRITLKNAKALVIGAGGAARSALAVLSDSLCDVRITNRTKDKADKLAKEFNAKVCDWQDFSAAEDVDILINCTSSAILSTSELSGSSFKTEESDVVLNYANKLKAGKIAFDCAYSANGTPFAKAALEKGALVIDGLEMLASQAINQFKLYTGKEVKFEVLYEALKNGR